MVHRKNLWELQYGSFQMEKKVSREAIYILAQSSNITFGDFLI